MSENGRPRHIIGPLNIYGVMALAGVVGPLVLIIADLTAAASEPSYSLIRDSVSSLAWTHMGWIQTIGFLTIGLLVEVFVAGLLFSIRGRGGFGLGIGLLVCFGFGLLLIGAFRTNPVGSQPTIEGTIHGVGGKAVFFIFPLASLLIALSLKKDPHWKGLFTNTIVSGSLALALVIGGLWLPEKVSWFGLYERILIANTIIWVELMAIRLLRLSLRARQELRNLTTV